MIEIRKDGTEILRAIYSATDKKFVSVGEEEYGMLYDDKFYEKAVNEFEESFQKVFFEKMLLREKVCSFGHMGYVKLYFVFKSTLDDKSEISSTFILSFNIVYFLA